VLKGNQNNEGLHIPLTGSAIGNGLVDPEIQYAYYAEMAYHNEYKPVVNSLVVEFLEFINFLSFYLFFIVIFT
jgi:carboxypeptidase C (cathepsin A)